MKTRTLRTILAITVLPSVLFAADADNDGLDDSVETNTGVYVSPTNTGTDPNNPDSDGDGAGDWYEIAIIDVAPTATQPNSPNSAAIKPNIPYPLPAPDASTGVTNEPVKVYILSGQSNMVGQGNVGPLGTLGTLATITQTEKKFPNLRNGAVLDAAGYTIRNDVMYRGIIAATGDDKLKVGQGAGTTKIGPELGFGHVMGYYHDEPVLVLKSSEGGRAIGWDFLPPGSVQYTVGSTVYAGYGDSPASWTTGTTPVPTAFYGGYQFDQCFRRKADWAPAGAANPASTTVASVLDNWQNDYAAPGKPFEGMDFEIAGFAWFQGWNDGLSYTTAYANNYEKNMAQFIRQIRAYFESRYPGKIQSKAPFVIATAAFDGWNEAYLNQYPTRRAVINAQLAVSNDPVKYPDFVGNVKTMEARGFWRDVSASPANNQSHYNLNAETYMLVGDALGRGMIDLLGSASPDTLPPTITAFNPLDNATNLATNTNLAITFNEAIALGTGNITIRNLTDSTQSTIAITDGSQVSIDGAFLTINPSANLTGGKNYAIRIDAGALKDYSNNAFAGIADDATWNFTTLAPDVTAPAASSVSPADNTSDVAVGANLVMNFSEPIALGSGNITIRNLSNSTQRTIPVTDATQVTLSGSSLSVNPSANLPGNSSLAIRIDAGAVKDLSDNPFAGIADDNTWNFSTAAPPTSAGITIISQAEGFLGSDRTKVTTAHDGTTQVSYDATGVDKLVVVFATESGFNAQTTTAMTMSFNGVAMTLGKFQQTFPNPIGNDNGAVAIFYLDDPFQGAANFTAGVTNTGGGANGGHVSIIGLTGTQDGIGAVAGTSHTDVANGNSVGTSITTTAVNSLVIAGIQVSGSNNVTGSIPTAVSPLTLSNNGSWGSNWGHGASGYQAVPGSGTTITPTFVSGTSRYVDVTAVEFLVSDIAPNAYEVWSAQYPTADLTDPSADIDKGGLPVGIEWVVGGDPTDGGDDAGKAPTFSNSDPDNFVFTYRRRDAASTDAGTTIAAQYGTSLGDWSTATHGVNGIAIDDGIVPEAGFRTVMVSIPKTLAGSSGRLFARLKVVVASP